MRGEAGMIKAETHLKYNGKLQILNEPKFRVKSKLPWCDLNAQLEIKIQNGETIIENNRKTSLNYSLSYVSLSIYLNDILISISSLDPGPLFLVDTGILTFDNIFNTFNLMHVESIRNGDISFKFIISGYYTYIPEKSNYNEAHSPQDAFSISTNHKFSEREWLKLLSEMGYGEKMVIAIDRPKLEGYHEVLEFIEKANDGLLNNANPDDVIKNLRAAWKSMNTYLKNYNDELGAEINGQSKTDIKDSKPEKIEKIKNDTITLLEALKSLEDDVYNLTHIGAHPETYTSNREDALLAFRLTVSLMSYYSGVLNEITKKGGQ